jgi:1,4-alpha-glucan branching enzyme
MPWTAWRGGQFSWGYNPFAFFAVENRYLEQPGGDETSRLYRLKTLVNALHRRGIHVLMDGVFNHVDAGAGTDGKGFPYHWLYQDPEESPFTGGFERAGYFEDLDFNNRCTEQFIFDACRFWLDEYQFDGVRLDYTLGFYRERNPGQGLTKLVADLRAHLQATGRDDVAITLEHMSDNRDEAIDVTNKVCADACWYDRLHWDLPAAAVHGVDPALMRALDSDRDFAPPKQPMIYLGNHDHSSLTNRVGGRNRWWRVQAPLIALCTTPGGILLHNGQEFGQVAARGRRRPRPAPAAALGAPRRRDRQAAVRAARQATAYPPGPPRPPDAELLPERLRRTADPLQRPRLRRRRRQGRGDLPPLGHRLRRPPGTVHRRAELLTRRPVG